MIVITAPREADPRGRPEQLQAPRADQRTGQIGTNGHAEVVEGARGDASVLDRALRMPTHISG